MNEDFQDEREHLSGVDENLYDDDDVHDNADPDISDVRNENNSNGNQQVFVTQI